jgi:hypothetical protein
MHTTFRRPTLWLSAFCLLHPTSAWADVLVNGGVDTIGPSGASVSGSGPSAALGWNQFTVVPGSQITSDLETSTDPLGSGEMIHILTDNGFWGPASQGNGFHQGFSTLPSATASFDIDVVSGKVTGGLVLATGPFAQFTPYQAGGGWQHVVENVNAPVIDIEFEVLTPTNAGGAEFYLDNLQVTPTPEPSMLPLLAGLLVFALGWRCIRRADKDLCATWGLLK